LLSASNILSLANIILLKEDGASPRSVAISAPCNALLASVSQTQYCALHFVAMFAVLNSELLQVRKISPESLQWFQQLILKYTYVFLQFDHKHNLLNSTVNSQKNASSGCLASPGSGHRGGSASSS
jgi:hypothetical protein